MLELSKPYIGKSEINSVIKVLKSGRLSIGPKLIKFESNFAKYIGTKYGIGVNSGTSGLHLALKAVGIKEGDEVITTPFSFIASANSILYLKAKPIFVDINKKTLNIDENKIEKSITTKTKAILVVHIFGEPCNMEKINKIAKKYRLKVIEDTCESIGSTYKGKILGSWGDVAVFAFYPNKQITTGEGGMIVTNNKKIKDICKSLRNQGRTKNKKWLNHEYLGYNYRLTEINSALGIEQLKKINKILKKRKAVAKRYNSLLKDTPNIELPIIKNEKSWFVYVIKLNKKINRENLINRLNKKGIDSKPYFPSIHLQPLYKKLFKYKKGLFPICEEVSEKTLAIPFYTDMKKNDVEFVCKNLKELIATNE